MKLSKIVAILAWLNSFGLCWAMMYGPELENRGSVVTGMILFVLIALTASGIQAGPKNDKTE